MAELVQTDSGYDIYDDENTSCASPEDLACADDDDE